MRFVEGRAGAPAPVAARLAASLAASLAACGPDPTGGELTPDVSAMLGHLPGDAHAIIGINAARARQVPALRGLLTWLPDAPIDPAVAGACAIDPGREVDQVVASLGAEDITGGGADRVFVAMKGGFTRDSIAACLARAEERPAITLDGAVTAYAVKKARSHVYWPAADVAIVAPAARDSRAALDPVVAGGSAVQASRLMSYVGRVRTGAAFWMAGPLPAVVQEELARLGTRPPDGFFISLDADEDDTEIRLVVGLRLGGERQARAAARAFRRQRGELGRAVPDERARAVASRLEISHSGAEVTFRASLGAAESEMLLDVLTPFLP